MRCSACDVMNPKGADRCKSCGKRLRKRPKPEPDSDQGRIAKAIPIKNKHALIAYYFGIFGLIPVVGLLLGPAGIVFGILGYNYAEENPNAKGRNHALAGLILGGIGFVISLVFLVLWLRGIVQFRRWSDVFG